ncbi:MAG: orotate phosphoribosyltransferase [Oscillospiraceae bacterium]|jgi:orotate phosphoribosyltransferase|nr:orotate phosphoribosyltransferase [Oscillospiraceae bacterium]
MDKAAIAKRIYAAAHLTGTFTLRSGQVSNEYFDKYLFEADPVLLADIAKVMKPLIPEGTEVLAGLEMGGIPVVTALSAESGAPAAFVRKKAKEYGTCRLAEGADIAGKKVCVVEDVVTTGGQIIESVKELRQRGADVETVLCVILRNEKAVALLANEGLTLIPAFTMEFIKESAKI